ncbi:MAG: membrane protein insertion efficiency factor YidD [Campylobacterales bacterium]|nr:membrane protein insertion efficiency factor YidD [Campylobacterales bacterium]
MISTLAIQLINFYQRYISPHKGYRCAYRVYTGDVSCSEYAKISIQKNGVFRAYPLIKEQFAKCKCAHEALKKEKETETEKKKNSSDTCGSGVDCLAPCADILSYKHLDCDVCACGFS